MVSKATEGVQNIKISQNNSVAPTAPANESAPGSPKIVPNNIHLQNNNATEEGSRTPSGVRNQQESTFSIAGGECKLNHTPVLKQSHFIFPIVLLVHQWFV